MKLLKSAGSESINVFPCFSGTSNRTVASTNMNATSSRAHTVVTITFDQIIKNEMGSETKKSSVMNLVDLAGKTDGLCWLSGLYLNIPTIQARMSFLIPPEMNDWLSKILYET